MPRKSLDDTIKDLKSRVSRMAADSEKLSAAEQKAAERAQRQADKAAARAEKAAAKEAREAARRVNIQEGIMETAGELWSYRTENDQREPSRKVVQGTLRVTTAVLVGEVMHLEVVLVRQEDNRIFRAPLEMVTMEKVPHWNAWFGATAGLSVNMTESQRLLLKDYVMSQDGAKAVSVQLARGGFVEEHGIFAALGHCVGHDGALVPQDDGGGFPLRCSDGSTRTFRTAAADGVPSPVIRTTVAPWPKEATEILRAYIDTMTAYQQDHSGAIAYGWAVASLFRHEIFAARRAFPHLYLYGRRLSGKSTLARCVMASCGLGDIPSESADSVKRNPKATRNLLGDVGCVPLWIDELRQDDGIEVVLNLLRSAYDGSGGRIAQRDGQTKVFPIRRSILLSGQHVVGSDAELRRYVLVDMREKKNDALYSAVTAGAETIQPAIVSLLTHRAALAPAILRYAEQYEQMLFAMGVTRAMVWPWGVALAGLRLAWSGANDELTPINALPIGAVEYAISRIKVVREGASAIQTFWQIMEVLDAASTPSNTGKNTWGRVIQVPDYSKNMVDKPQWVEEAKLEKGLVLAIWLGAAHSHVKQSAAKTRQSMHTVDALLREFADEPGYITSVDGVPLDAATPPRRCMLFSTDAPCIPRWVRDAAMKNGLAIPA